jgi:hypothetical protein
VLEIMKDSRVGAYGAIGIAPLLTKCLLLSPSLRCRAPPSPPYNPGPCRGLPPAR